MDDVSILHAIWDELSVRGLLVPGYSTLRRSCDYKCQPMIVVRQFQYIDMQEGNIRISKKGFMRLIYDSFCLSDPECIETVLQKIQKANNQIL